MTINNWGSMIILETNTVRSIQENNVFLSSIRIIKNKYVQGFKGVIVLNATKVVRFQTIKGG